MNILLVDDDRFIIKALQETIHWEALGIEQVYTASSLSQAQAIIQSRTPRRLVVPRRHHCDSGTQGHARNQGSARRGSGALQHACRHDDAVVAAAA